LQAAETIYRRLFMKNCCFFADDYDDVDDNDNDESSQDVP
jgi:hypothetical protein